MVDKKSSRILTFRPKMLIQIFATSESADIHHSASPPLPSFSVLSCFSLRKRAKDRQTVQGSSPHLIFYMLSAYENCPGLVFSLTKKSALALAEVINVSSLKLDDRALVRVGILRLPSYFCFLHQQKLYQIIEYQ
jgi:hypothetical protein